MVSVFLRANLEVEYIRNWGEYVSCTETSWSKRITLSTIMFMVDIMMMMIAMMIAVGIIDNIYNVPGLY